MGRPKFKTLQDTQLIRIDEPARVISVNVLQSHIDLMRKHNQDRSKLIRNLLSEWANKLEKKSGDK